jgi:hypothetical protein
MYDVLERLAIEGEVLITYRFHTGWIGLASPVEIAAANRIEGRRSLWSAWMRLLEICLQPDRTPSVRVSPGTHLRVNPVPNEIAVEYAVGTIEDVTFVHLAGSGCLHRDAIRFGNGRHVLLQRFREGVVFQVLADGSDDGNRNEEPLEASKLRQPEAGSYSGVCGRVG